MTSSWFETIAAMKEKRPLPLQLFSIGKEFRRDHKETKDTLAEELWASIVIADSRSNLEDGRTIARGIIKELGTDVRFMRRESTSKYYARNMEEKIIALREGKEFEIGHIGMYSPIGLSSYGINIPVFNLAIRLDKLAMVMDNCNDIRELVYPQFYAKIALTDEQIAELITIDKKPKTELGKAIAKDIVKTAEHYAQKQSPARFKVYEKQFKDKRLEVWLIAPESGKRVCGSAYLKEVYVHDGNVIAAPPMGEDGEVVEQARKKGIRTGIRFIDAFADLVAYNIEGMHGDYFIVKVGDVASHGDVNITVPRVVKDFAASRKKRISIEGPMFTAVEIKYVT